MDERSEKVSGLFNEAGETHHIFAARLVERFG